MNLPAYAVDIFMAAKSVACPPTNATVRDQAAAIKKRAKTESDVEAQMPVIHGKIQEGA